MVIICPYCLNRVNPKRERDGFYCPVCSTRIFSDFVLQPLPKHYIGMVGFSGHGKTTYITSLLFLLKDVFMGKGLWKGFSFLALDMETLNLIYNRVKALTKEARLPEATPVNFPTPFVIKFFNLPLLADRFITFYDVGGEVFEHPDRISRQGVLVAKAEKVIFIISLKDCGEDWEERSDRATNLLNTFILGRDQVFPGGKEYQDLVVTFTKADLLVKDMPKTLVDSLLSGTYDRYVNITRNFPWELAKLSQDIEEWLATLPGMSGFIALAKRNFRDVKFSLISAIGSAPIGDRLAASLRPEDPKRVLDPFFLSSFTVYQEASLLDSVLSFFRKLIPFGG